jgi:hypothetical protein
MAATETCLSHQTRHCVRTFRNSGIPFYRVGIGIRVMASYLFHNLLLRVASFRSRTRELFRLVVLSPPRTIGRAHEATLR